MIDLMRLRKHIVENVPDAVVYPRNRADIIGLVKYCTEHKIPMYVYGGGSSVTRGVEPVCGGITLDMRKNFNKVIRFSEHNQTITVEAGMSGPQLEEVLNNAPEKLHAKGRYTCGHFPQSFEYSSVGAGRSRAARARTPATTERLRISLSARNMSPPWALSRATSARATQPARQSTRS